MSHGELEGKHARVRHSGPTILRARGSLVSQSQALPDRASWFRFIRAGWHATAFLMSRWSPSFPIREIGARMTALRAS